MNKTLWRKAIGHATSTSFTSEPAGGAVAQLIEHTNGSNVFFIRREVRDGGGEMLFFAVQPLC